MTVVLSMALIGSSVLITHLIFLKRMKDDVTEDCETSAVNMARRILDDEDFYEFILSYAEKMRALYAENYDDLVYHYENGFSSREEEAEYYSGLTAPFFPASSGFGTSYEQLLFKNNYESLLHELLLVSKSFNTEGGFIYIYDAEHDYLVYLMDCTSYDSTHYAYPASIKRPAKEWSEVAKGKLTATTYETVDKYGVPFAYGTYPITRRQTDEVVAYVSYNYDLEGVRSTEKGFTSTITVTMVIAMVIITAIYLLLAEFFLIRNIRKLSASTLMFTDNLVKNGKLTLVDGGVRTRDEVGTLSSQFGVMQQKIAEYVETIAEKTEEEHRRETELSIAAEIQNEELPIAAYDDKMVSVRAVFTAAKEVGGDFYDYFYVDEKRFAVVIADVTGKGIPAALFMMKVKSLIKTKLKATGDLKKTMEEVNDALLENNRAGLFVTAFVGVIDVENKNMLAVSAGHEKPYLLKDGKVEKLNLNSNFVLGGIKGFTYKTEEVYLGDNRLFLFTDGLNEAINDLNEEFGYGRVEKILEEAVDKTHEETLNSIQTELKSFVGEKEPFDDVTLFMVELHKEGCSLRFENPDFDAIEKATDAVFGAFPSIEKDVLSKIGVVIDEIFNNLISYEKKDNFVVTLKAKTENGKFAMVISSNGEPFDPLSAPETRDGVGVDDSILGGFGIMLAKSLSSDISYSREDDKNVLTIVFDY